MQIPWQISFENAEPSEAVFWEMRPRRPSHVRRQCELDLAAPNVERRIPKIEPNI